MLRLPLLAAVLAVLATACSGTSQAAPDQGFILGDGSATVVPVADREAAPAVEGVTLDGEQLALADMDGPVVVNFWASWCGPCDKEAPALRRVALAYDGRVRFVGVNLKDQTVAANNFEQTHEIPYPSWDDEAASIAAAFGGIGPAALPSTIVLDAEHRVAVRLFGAVDEPRLSAHLDAVLDEDAG
jgi:thiol-disulfide isomerase/thioredoxin